MTPEEKAANVELLARVVLKADVTVLGQLVYLRDEDGLESLTPWDHYTSITDAMEMLDKFHAANLGRRMTGYICTLYVDTKLFEGHSSSAADAICAACLEWARAQGEKR